MNMYIVTPIAGAAIGYFTNWLAIKMLFRPYNEIKIAGKKLPFTPGLIPSERYIISKNIGNTLSEHLLTEDVLVEYINKNLDLEELLNNFQPELQKIKDKDLTLNSLLEIWFEESKSVKLYEIEKTLTNVIYSFVNSKEFDSFLENTLTSLIDSLTSKKLNFTNITNLTNILTNTIKLSISENSLVDLLQELKTSQIKLENYVDEEALAVLINKATYLGRDRLLTLLKDNEYTNEKLKEIVFKLIDANVSGLAAMFVNKENLYAQIHSSLVEYIENEENIDILANYFSNYSKEILNNTLEQTLNKMSDESIEKVISFISLSFNNKNLADKISEKLIKHLSNSDCTTLHEILIKFDADYKTKSTAFLSKKIKSTLQNKKEFDFSILTKLILSIKINYFIDILEKNKNLIIKKSSYLINLIVPYAIKNIDVATITEEQMNRFDIAEVEALIQSISKKELRAITYVGALLGFIIGLLPLLIKILDNSF